MALNFPANPNDGDTYEGYVWNATVGAWQTVSTAINLDLTSPVAGDTLVYDGANWVNGPRSGNAIINGDFGIWQRGTSFTLSDNAYTADRWEYQDWSGSATVSRQDFTPADIEAVGYGDAEYFLRMASNGGAANSSRLFHKIEDVRTFAGQEVTLSFWAKSDSARDYVFQFRQNFGSGGSTETGEGNLSDTISLTTSWQRFTFSGPIASVAGKTIGTGSYLILRFFNAVDESSEFDLWGVQLEAGPVATPFKLAGGGSKAAELALCQRYYQFITFQGTRYISTAAYCYTDLFSEMRVIPSLATPSSLTNIVNTLGVGAQTATGFASQDTTRQKAGALFTGIPSGTIGVPVATTEGIAIDAEL